MKRKNREMNTVEYKKLMLNPAVAENKDFKKIYRYILKYYSDRGPCPALIFMDDGVKEPIYIKNSDGAEAIIVNRRSERLYEDVKRTVRKSAVLCCDKDFKGIWTPEVDYGFVYKVLLVISNRLKIPAIPLYIVKQMPTGYEKLVGMTLQNVEQKTTAIMLNGTRDETMMINSLVHELRHAWQHMYHQDWFDDYNINLPLENYFDQITECDAAAYAYLFTFYSCGLRLEPSVGQEKVLQRVRELEKEDLFW